MAIDCIYMSHFTDSIALLYARKRKEHIKIYELVVPFFLDSLRCDWCLSYLQYVHCSKHFFEADSATGSGAVVLLETSSCSLGPLRDLLVAIPVTLAYHKHRSM